MRKDITKDCVVELSVICGEALIYISYKGKKLGLFDLAGFHPMYELREKVFVEPGFQAADQVCWFKMFIEETSLPQWTDITTECTTELRKSGQSDGYYSGIMHDGVLVAALGFGRTKPINIKKGYKVEPAKGAVVSFRVFKKNTGGE